MKLLEDSSGSHVSQLLNVSRRGQTRTKMWSCIEKKPQVGCHGSHVVRRAPKHFRRGLRPKARHIFSWCEQNGDA